jgi:hypothetical protein
LPRRAIALPTWFGQRLPLSYVARYCVPANAGLSVGEAAFNRDFDEFLIRTAPDVAAIVDDYR